MLHRLGALISIIALVAAACGGGESADSTSVDPGPSPSVATTEAASATTVIDPSGPETTGASDRTTTTSDREVAPDFTLELGDGGSYTLSEGSKPVYLVFWAEW